MKPFWLMPLALLASACSFTAQQDTVQGQFNPPLVYQDWHSNQYTARNGMKVCAVSSGNNGIIVTLGQTASGTDVVVASNRPMRAGTEFSVNVDGKHFETADKYFPEAQGRELADAMSKGAKAYLEWSETGGNAGGQRIRVQNVVKLDDFHVKYKACRDSLGS